jgi:hypothetical protein
MMKRVLVLIVMGMFLAGLASASSIFENCTVGVNDPYVFSGGAGSTTFTCPGATGLPVGAVVTEVILWEAGDYQYGTTGSNEIQIVDTISSGTWTNVDWASSTHTCDVSGGGSSNTTPCTYTAVYPPSDVYSYDTNAADISTFAASGFTVGSVSTIVAGGAAGSTSGLYVEYDYAPEPTTMAMVGGLLIGLGTLVRKRLV